MSVRASGNLVAMRRNPFADEETLLALGLYWTVGMLFFTLGGFYLANIVAVPIPHDRDLQVRDMANSLRGAAVGAAIGVVFGLFWTFVYPRLTRKDYEHDMAVFRGEHGHHHGADHEAEPHHAS